MENSQQLATESFSYTWLTDKEQSSYDALFNSLSENKEQNLNFDFPHVSKSSLAFVHADEIFSNGHILPFYVNKSTLETFTTSNSVPSSPASESNKIRFYVKWRKSSKRILQRCFGFVRTIGFSRKNSKVDDAEQALVSNHAILVLPRSQSSVNSVGEWADVKKISTKFDSYYGLKRAKSWSSRSPQVSPRIRTFTTCDSDQSSIHEAIIYCKRSLEK
ncbi:hypothetical protein ACJIZ3_018504 [Penstemon smallii]|uniref:Uncharacterized protein n=1 Tax=Penstemon smallii TaxID=265156 RepID=A0ABD3SZZ8_9LAMI